MKLTFKLKSSPITVSDRLLYIVLLSFISFHWDVKNQLKNKTFYLRKPFISLFLARCHLKIREKPNWCEPIFFLPEDDSTIANLFGVKFVPNRKYGIKIEIPCKHGHHSYYRWRHKWAQLCPLFTEVGTLDIQYQKGTLITAWAKMEGFSVDLSVLKPACIT